MLKQYDYYCSCVSKKSKKINKLKEKDSLAWKFTDPKQQHEIKDYCAIEHLDSESLALNYTINFNSHIYPLIDSLLANFHSSTFRTLASVNSYSGHISCLKERIRKKCSKVHSLKLTHICIQKSINNPNEIMKMKKSCPNFKTKGDQEVPEISNENKNFI